MGEDGSTPEVTNPQGKVGEKRSEAVGWLSKWGVCVCREEDLKKKKLSLILLLSFFVAQWRMEGKGDRGR